MARLQGMISITGLPPHRGIIIHLCFFAVVGPDAPVPHNSDPPANAATDCDKVFEQVDLNNESQETTFEHHFGVDRPSGHYYVQVRVMLFRTHGGKVFAQAEQFFFGSRPLHIPLEPESQVTFPVTWPTEPLDALHHHGTIRPQTNRPWWRFW